MEPLQPFNLKYTHVYLRVNNQGRKIVDLWSKDHRTTLSYARYLMSVHLGVEIDPNLEIDHINDDKSDDRIENLQILTKEQNRYKEFLRKMSESESFVVQCAECRDYMLMRERDLRYKRSTGRVNIFCSKTCSARFYSVTQNNRTVGINKSQEVIDAIKNLRENGLSCYKIAEQLKISRNTVLKYW